MNDLEVGLTSEDLFASEARKRGLTVSPSTKNENMFSHIDFHVTKRFTVDVKAMKRTHKAGNQQDEWTWVEFVNVRGNKGWLYGDADYIAFERENDYVIIYRKALVVFCESVIPKTYVNNAYEARYKRYKRSGRDDEIAMIKLDDVIKSLSRGNSVIVWSKK